MFFEAGEERQPGPDRRSRGIPNARDQGSPMTHHAEHAQQMVQTHPTCLLRRIRTLTGLFMIGLLISGATAMPLVTELTWLVEATGARERVESPASTGEPAWAVWLVNTEQSLVDTQKAHPQLFYGMDWLAFGHFVIAIAFVGAWRDPARNCWLFDFGLIACALVIPWALLFGAIRGIPFWWRLVDCSFGVVGAVPLWVARTWAQRLQACAVRQLPS